MSATTDPTIVTPDVYLNHLRADEIEQFETSRNLYIATVAALTCDVLSHVPSDIKTIKQSGGLVAAACFAFVRIFAIIYMALWVSMSTTPVANCNGIVVGANTFCLLTMTMTSFLFLRRIQAIYHDNRAVKYSFALLWAGTSGVVAVLIPGTQAKYIPGTRYCKVYETKDFVAISHFMPAVFDSLVFFAVSYRIVFQHNRELGHEFKLGWTHSWFSTKTLPVLTKAIFQGGQQYYLVTFIINIISGAFSFNPSVPRMSRTLIGVPAVALSACMACHAHRMMVVAFHRDEVSPQVVSTFVVAAGTGTSIPHAAVEAEKGILGHNRAGLES